MSTNGIIARSTGESTFAGRYHHWDSYPSGLGVALVEAYRGYFKRDLDRMLQFLLDEHTGWSTIVRKDFSLKPGYTNVAQRPEGMSIEDFSKLPLNRRPQCYCHGARHEEGFIADEKSDCGAEWAYIFETIPGAWSSEAEPEQRILHVLTREKHKDSDEYFWQEVGRIDLNSDEEINWVHIECGENFERCHHYAWVHFPQLKGTDIGIQQFLGRAPFRLCDAIGFIINGKRVKATGSCGDADFLRCTSHHAGLPKLPPSTWIATVVHGNGKRAEIPVALRGPEGEKPFPGVKWIFPPTLVNSSETVVG